MNENNTLPEFDFDELDDMIALAETNVAMRNILAQLYDVMSQAQLIYDLSKPVEPVEEENSVKAKLAGIKQAFAAAKKQKSLSDGYESYSTSFGSMYGKVPKKMFK